MSPDVVAVLVALGAGGVAAVLGWPITRFTLHLAAGRDRVRRAEALSSAGEAAPDEVDTLEGRPADPTSGVDSDVDGEVDDDGLLRGGLWIGVLERAFVAGGIAVEEPAILAVVVAIKGLGRVPELLKSPTAGERFIIGSLASLGVALGVGVIGRALIG